MPAAGALLQLSFRNRPRVGRARTPVPSRSRYWPVPVSLITAGPRGALCVTVAAPVIEPVRLGVKVTLKVQVAAAATVAPQGVEPDGAAVKSPLATMLEIVRVAPELLVRVTVCGALVVPTV